ncbi:DUF397 domain-containing protein [Streptomyces varsoviensis]|uniref:DUF397 domain-containing protein n=2 Tax=Streptomyces varsoviensis TaxID=67373 RepID=A0ABR5IVN4_9ACTN|nr:DUF397 domain-containing protein [Streptomyces varsoviensis]KOG85199.1 hypothetical protein ADK38_38025 [Streptomyces varsoviensis]
MARVVEWQKSSFSSGGDSANCVELAAVGGTALLRESEEPASMLTLTRPGLAGLLRQVKAGGPGGGFGPPVRR